MSTNTVKTVKALPVALVTGATSGIGVEIARRLVHDGFRVVVTGRDEGRGAAVVRELHDLRGNTDVDGVAVTFVRADLTDEGAAQAVVDATVEKFGRLDVLVNNAAIDHTDDLAETPVATVRHVFETNAIAPLTMLQAAARQMRRQNAEGDGAEGANGRRGGAIINVTSRLAHIGVPTMAVYSAAKGAVRSLTTAASVELAPDNIRVNAVAPGMTRTPLFDDWLAEQDDPAATEKRVGEEVPLGRVAESADVAAAVGYLASDGASYITGTTIPVDGGYTAK